MLVHIPLWIVIVFSFLFIIIFYLLINSQKQIGIIIDMPPKQTIFDPLAANGMAVIDHFLKVIFLKYMNNKLIQLNEKNEMSVSNFLNSIASIEEMANFSTGFTMLVVSQMSKQLKSFFNKYYNVLDKNGEPNENFINYVSEWLIINIRAIQAKVSVEKGGGLDYSIEKELKVNANIFTEIELSLYKELHIISEDDIKVKKEVY